MQLQLLKSCNKKRSVFITFCSKYVVEIEKDLYLCSVKN